jgi:maltose-binding protein MalE
VEKMKKKIFGILLIFALSFIIASCGGGNASATINGASDKNIALGSSFDEMTGVTAEDSETGDITSSITVSGSVDVNTVGSYTLTYKVTGSDGVEVVVERKITVTNDVEPEEIVIMHGAPYEVDPFHDDYKGTQQLEKQQRQEEVEALYNVKITYKAFPANAPWGPDRVTAIVNASVAGDPLADIYWTTSDWTQQLADKNAIVPIDDYLDTTGENIDEDFLSVGLYKEQHYAFGPEKLTVDLGLYYNADLVSNLGVENPTEMYLEGRWNWTNFENWATQVQTALTTQGDDLYALGGALSAYAESMVPLNGGSLINATTGRVAFNQNPALETYTFLSDLYGQGLFEPDGQYDAGSPLWQTGKVAMHPGSLWFVKADNRWGGLAFELGYVPYPVADDFSSEDYVSPVSGVATYNIASGMTDEREALVFEVWNALQLWKTDEEFEDEFEVSLLTKFDDEIYVEAYLEIYDQVYLEIVNALGISAYSTNGWRSNINHGIKEGTARTLMDQIEPIYAAELEKYLN